MIDLNDDILRTYCEDIEKKKVPAISEPNLVNEFLTYIQLHNEHMKKVNAYEIASTIRSFKTWSNNAPVFSLKAPPFFISKINSSSLPNFFDEHGITNTFPSYRLITIHGCINPLSYFRL